MGGGEGMWNAGTDERKGTRISKKKRCYKKRKKRKEPVTQVGPAKLCSATTT